MADDNKPPQGAKLLCLVRMADGRLIPHVDGEPIMGWVDTTTNSNGSQQLTQLVFHSSMVLFETAKNPAAGAMN
jgi:hypothetical protein